MFQNDHGLGQVLDVGERYLHSGDVAGAAEFLHLAVDDDLRFAQGVVHDFDFGKFVAAAPARAHGLEEGLLGGEAGGEVLGGAVLGFAVGDLARREELGPEARGPFEFLPDPLNFDDVGAKPENHRAALFR